MIALYKRMVIICVIYKILLFLDIDFIKNTLFEIINYN